MRAWDKKGNETHVTFGVKGPSKRFSVEEDEVVSFLNPPDPTRLLL